MAEIDDLLEPGVARSLGESGGSAAKLRAASALDRRADRGGAVSRGLARSCRAGLRRLLPRARRAPGARAAISSKAPPPHPEGEGAEGDAIVAFAGRSIICFAPRVADGAGGFRRLDLRESELLFRRLNADLRGRLDGLDALESALAAQPMHIGQPVDLTPGSEPPNVILRLVIGARFFSTIAMAGDHAEAALDAEIGDGLRALDKAELILARWGELERG